MAFQFNQGDRPLPGYTIQRGVGRGGFGEVYYGTSDGGKEVALKYLRENPQVELRGVTHCLNLKSPHLVANHDIKQNSQGDFFVIMEYINGPSLRDLMNEEPQGLGPQKAAYFLREIGKGLAYLHDRGIVHRDLKPGNIFYEDGYVKIGDYGLAKIMAASQHSGQTVSVGTVHYMAPEVGSGNYDRTIDIYAMGVVLYEMLLGRVPFSGSSMGEVLMKHLTAQPEVDALPNPFPAVIRKAMAKDPEDRYQSVNEMMAEVFAVEDISRSVASVDSLNLTRVAAAVAQKVKAGVAAGLGKVADHGSSNVPPLGTTPVSPAPPPVVERDRGVDPHGDRVKNPLWEDFKNRPFGLEHQKTASYPQRQRTTVGLMGLFLGPFGAHRFYTGHNFIGVVQILATIFTGVGAFWGIIEGIQILANGAYIDSLGRPLLNTKPYDPRARSVVARFIFGFVGLAATFGSVGLILGCILNRPEYESIFQDGTRFLFNAYHWMFVAACGALGLAAFCFWKASHSGGKSFWQATGRPGLMCFFLSFAWAALAFEWFIAPQTLQIVGIIIAACSFAAFMFVWQLRGIQTDVRAGDAYWHTKWMTVFIAFTVLFMISALVTGAQWAENDFRSVVPGPDRIERTIVLHRWSGEAASHTFPKPVYDHNAIFCVICSLLAMGSAGEAYYRRKVAIKAAGVLGDER